MSLADDYRAIQERAAVGSVSPRRQIGVAGSDRAAFLHGLLTNDIQALTPGSGCYAAWLTPQGRMHTDLHVLELGDMTLLDVPASKGEAILQRLDQVIFSEDVRPEALDGRLTSLWIHGPAAGSAIETSLAGADGAGNWPNYRVAHARMGEAPAIVVRIDQLRVPGYGVYLPPSSASPLREALRRAGAIDASQDAIEAARIEAAYPVFGVDMTEETIPLEAGIEDRAISFTKGCYVGQEVIIRVLHRGHGRVARRLVGLRFDGAAPARLARLRAAERDVGFVTSAAVSPQTGAIGLGYVHRDFVEAGTALQAQDGEACVPAVVSGSAAPKPASA